MYQIDQCPACNNVNIHMEDAKLARFVAWRSSGIEVPDDIDIIGIQCSHCSYVGSAYRFTMIERDRLYKGYRETEYNALREICEPGYTHLAGTFISPEYRISRTCGIDKLMVPLQYIKSVLDYGGNGELIPLYFLETKKYTLDISGVNRVPGTFLFNSAEPVDFLMCCHVLEHESELDTLLDSIKECVHKDSWLYFEVPNNPKPYIGIFHEHINFFNYSSLSALLNRNGFNIIDSCTYEINSNIMAHENNLCVLAKVK